MQLNKNNMKSKTDSIVYQGYNLAKYQMFSMENIDTIIQFILLGLLNEKILSLIKIIYLTETKE